MKISGPGSLQPGSVRKSQKSGSGGEFGRLIGEDKAQSKAQSVAPQTLHALSSLFALQEVDDALEGRRKKAKARAEDILDRLEEIRLGLLTGAIPKERLLELVRIIQARRDQLDDPRLQEVLDEIDLQAQVEIAKLSR